MRRGPRNTGSLLPYRRRIFSAVPTIRQDIDNDFPLFLQA